MLKTMAPSTQDRPTYTKIDENELDMDGGGGIGSGRINNRIENLFKSTKVKKSPKTDFLTSRAKEVFNRLWKAFTKAPIFSHFDPECHIEIETDALGYIICGVLSQMALDQHSSNHVMNKDPNSKIGQWYLIAFFSQKIIPAKTHYETYNQEFLAIVEAFKTWRHYLKSCKYKVFILTNHNNLCWFIDTKSLSFR